MYYVWKEWKESIKGKGLWLSFSIIILVSISILLKSSALSFDQGFYVLLLNLFESLSYFLPLLCLFLGAFSVFQEKEQKTLIMLLTKRDHFGSFLFKKSIAIHVVFLGPILVWFFLYLAPVKLLFSIDVQSYLAFVLSVACILVTFTQLGILVGSISRSKMQIVGYTVAAWFYLFFLHDFILLSLLPQVTHDNVKLFSSGYFLNPIQAARMYLESTLGVYSFGHMSKLLKSFMWLTPATFLSINVTIFLVISYITAAIFHRKEASE